ncbi:hypothetical protein GQ600_17451 [Phytophthora cactorum]|nr:hypothetical protein GQ600_17451 [Phytophthora cactorum]
MPSGSSAGISSLPSSFSSSEHKSDSSSANSHALLPQPSSAAPPRTTDQLIELSVSSEELANWRRDTSKPRQGRCHGPVRIPAFGTNETGASAQTVWYLRDRPDYQTREEAELQMTLLYEKLRGDMTSTLSTCVAAVIAQLSRAMHLHSPLQTAIYTRNDGFLDPIDVGACVDRLHELGYINLSAFSLASAARDIEEIISRFQPDSQAIIYALGYGTLRFTDATISSGRVYTQLEVYCLFTGETPDACGNSSASTSSSSVVGTTLSYAMNSSVAAIPSGTSVLLLSGGLDALSPPKYSTALFNAFQTENKALLVAPKSTHGVVQSALLSNGTACARKVLASYVRNSGNLTSLDISCMTALPTPSLAISNTSSLLVLGVEDAYDGVLVVTNSSSGSVGALTGSSENSATSSGSTSDELNGRISALESSRHRYKVALVVVASVLGAVLVGGAVVMIYRRRRKQHLAGEEDMLRRMRGDEENELDLVRSIYLLSSSSPSSGGVHRPGGWHDCKNIFKRPCWSPLHVVLGLQ